MEPQKGDQDVLFRPLDKAEKTSELKGRGARVRLPRLSRPLLGCLVIVAAVFLCSGGAFVVANSVCAAYLPQRLPIYPGAQTRFQSSNFLTPFGMGITVVTLSSPDPPETVRGWYGKTVGTFLRQSVQSGDFLTTVGRQIARVQYDVTHAPEGTGSQIILYAKCMN